MKIDYGEWRPEMPMYTLNSKEDVDGWIVGTDADLGGKTTASLELTPNNTARFSGVLSTEVPANVPKHIANLGYAAMRTKTPAFTLLHTPTFDTTLFRYLAVRCRGDGKQWFVNIQTHNPAVEHDLYQHRLYFDTPGEWETVLIPFRDFILTNHGWIQKRQIEMDRMRVRTIGFSIARQPGPFELELDWVKAINTDKTYGDYDLQVQTGSQL
ncbi:NADH:ubiquinone oxidoreductase complex I intermediate-associated protein 30 [Gonapodya prolifera JEL478]|uniref:NADH:ubiquinone oxidoreductase complex I intermediate-associated protein 30 n=1 Tax=Gonapodya prolifera (strain JEL478) TaxID=1344416 RepID=A0A139A5S5_GONPJ|nr:NADH:ubiquinone oxidoreductase complex I intermediate-associated protein 30 [Gonapodya prolifera JEL478]|eukprot:KXS12114.1 NADH:ubiquinone oxidoreductase complex I intermediate-associated protein 30 [Gonapodya prolifera JEL478]